MKKERELLEAFAKYINNDFGKNYPKNQIMANDIDSFLSSRLEEKECDHKFRKAYYVNDDNEPIEFIGNVCEYCFKFEELT